jgi:hypothetical protein
MTQERKDLLLLLANNNNNNKHAYAGQLNNFTHLRCYWYSMTAAFWPTQLALLGIIPPTEVTQRLVLWLGFYDAATIHYLAVVTIATAAPRRVLVVVLSRVAVLLGALYDVFGSGVGTSMGICHFAPKGRH